MGDNIIDHDHWIAARFLKDIRRKYGKEISNRELEKAVAQFSNRIGERESDVLQIVLEHKVVVPQGTGYHDIKER